jgi:hypothetical protein
MRFQDVYSHDGVDSAAGDELQVAVVDAPEATLETVELLERLAALTPRPPINLVLYYSVLGARSAWRSRQQARDPETPVAAGQCTTDVTSSPRPDAPIRTRTNRLWAELMHRSFGFEVLACPRCGDRLELIALIEGPNVIVLIVLGKERYSFCPPNACPGRRRMAR